MTVVADGRGMISDNILLTYDMDRMDRFIWAPATLDGNVPPRHMYQVLGAPVPVHVFLPRNCNHTALGVKITPHLTCA